MYVLGAVQDGQLFALASPYLGHWLDATDVDRAQKFATVAKAVMRGELDRPLGGHVRYADSLQPLGLVKAERERLEGAK